MHTQNDIHKITQHHIHDDYCGLQLLESMSYKSKAEDYALGSQPENKEKNRSPDILPGKP